MEPRHRGLCLLRETIAMRCIDETLLESRALQSLIDIAPADGDTSEEGTRRARRRCAAALRAWRAKGNRARARWLRYHISFVGYPLKYEHQST
jgi:hypothetical protein